MTLLPADSLGGHAPQAPRRAAAGRLCIVAGISAAALSPALADTPDCDSISGGAPIIYGAGGTGPRDLVGAIAVVLENATDPLYVVYKDDGGSCSGMDALTGLGSGTITGTAYYWDPTSGSKTACNLPLSGQSVDFATLDVRGTNCPLVGGDESLLEGLVERVGPVDPVEVLVPAASTQTAISSEAFYLVYGLGAAAGIEPWTSSDQTYFQRRNEDSGTQTMISLASEIPSNKYIGTDAGGGSTLVNNLAALADPEAGIGFAVAASADGHRDIVHPLAWKAEGQDVAYWPDSDATTFDKANVRNGLYEVWANVAFYAYEGSADDSYADADVETFGEFLAGLSQPAGASKTIAEVSVSKYMIPMCAMNVARDTDMGPMYAYTPDEPCGCYFDNATTGATSCTACDDATPCSGTDVCRLGFCEAR